MEASMKTRVTKNLLKQLYKIFYFKITMDEIHPYYWQVDNDCMKKL
jgi:hypothetical protein